MWNPKKTRSVFILAAVLLITLNAGCSASSYKTSDGYSGTTRIGRSITDKTDLAAVQSVALLTFTGQNHGSGDGEDLEPVVMNAFEEFQKVFEGQDDIALIPVEQVAASPEYQAIQTGDLPEDVISPVEGLTIIPDDVPDKAIADLAESLDVDAVMTVHIDYDWDFPTFNAAELLSRETVYVIVPPDGNVVWQYVQSAWSKNLIEIPVNLKHLAGIGPTAEEWDEIIKITGEGPHTSWMGGALAYYFLDDASTTR